MKTNDVIGLGNALMDFLVEVDDDKLLEFNLNKGEFHLLEEDKAKELLTKLREHNFQIEVVPGGSAANTLRALGLLGANVILVGKVGQDEHGEAYVEQMRNHNVQTKINPHHTITGHALTFITPDSERTFSVHLGAAIEIEKEDIIEEDIRKSKILHLEGYQLEGKTRDVIMHALQFAKLHGTKISIDLADPGVIRRNKELLLQILKDYVDIVFVNETEAKEFTGKEEQEALQLLGNYCETVIVKLGEKGSLILHQGETHTITPVSAQAVDSTGAGDTYAAGFLYGYCNGWEVEKAGKLGSNLAAKIVETKGVKFDQAHLEESKNNFNIKIAIIGGSGLDNPEILQQARDIDVDTPYGKPSSPLKIGQIKEVDVVLLARHGREHTIPPTHVNNRANIHALKEAGCTHIIATTACGSLREEIGRGDFVILDQFIDFTRLRKLSFHDQFSPGGENAKHTPMAEPFNSKLREQFISSAQQLNLKFHPQGTVVTIEGPRFSTKAESKMFRLWGGDVINMSIAPEAILANEAGLPYAAVAMSTDYDCWKEDEEPVTWEEILKVFSENVEKVTKLLINTVENIGGKNES